MRENVFLLNVLIQIGFGFIIKVLVNLGFNSSS